MLQCIRPPYGVVYVAGKKHYFGVGGGTRQFKHLVENDGTLWFYFKLHPKKLVSAHLAIFVRIL